MKTNSNKLLEIIGAVLNVMWYVNMLLIAIAFTLLTFKFCTSDSVEFSAPIAATQIQSTKMDALATAAFDITVSRSQDMLGMNLKNTFGNIATAYFFLIALEVLAMTIIYQLRKFFKSIVQKKPFSNDNVRRLKITALCFALLTVLHILFGLSTKFIIEQTVKDFKNIHIVWTENFMGLAIGSAIYVLADVFKYGFSLQKENEEFV